MRRRCGEGAVEKQMFIRWSRSCDALVRSAYILSGSTGRFGVYFFDGRRRNVTSTKSGELLLDVRFGLVYTGGLGTDGTGASLRTLEADPRNASYPKQWAAVAAEARRGQEGRATCPVETVEASES